MLKKYTGHVNLVGVFKILIVCFLFVFLIRTDDAYAVGISCQQGSGELECMHSSSNELEGLRFYYLKKFVGNLSFTGSIVDSIVIDQVYGNYNVDMKLKSSISSKDVYFVLRSGNVAVLRDFSGDHIVLGGLVSGVRMVSIEGEVVDNLTDVNLGRTSSVGGDIDIYDMCARDGRLNFKLVNNRDVELLNVEYVVPDTGERVTFDMIPYGELVVDSSIGMLVELYMDGVLVDSVSFDGRSCDGFSEDVYKICEVDVNRGSVNLDNVIETGVKVRVRETKYGTAMFINVKSGSDKKIPELKNFLFE